MTPTRKSLIVLTAIVVMIGGQQVAQADPLVFSLQNNSLAGVAGGSVTFVASVTNTGATNTDTATISSLVVSNHAALGTASTIAFNSNFANEMVGNLDTLGPHPFATFNIAPGTPDGSYNGAFVFFYDTESQVGAIATTVNFTVRVGAGSAPVPEPATMLLLGSGLAGIAVKLKRRRTPQA